MVILIGGISHSGKTLLSQKLMEKYKIPYFSIDHLKMGIYRANPGRCGFTPESEDEIITKKLWPIIKGIIMTNIENNQNIIIEGIHLPNTINDLSNEYYSKIIFCKICFSKEYINKYFKNNIIKNRDVIEYREFDFEYSKKDYIEINNILKNNCVENGIKYFEIIDNYETELNDVYNWIDKEYTIIKSRKERRNKNAPAV